MIVDAAKESDVFIPDFEIGDGENKYDNRTADESEQVRVIIRYPNNKERRKLFEVYTRQETKKKKKKFEDDYQDQYIKTRDEFIVVTFIEEIINFWEQSSKGKFAITTGEELLDCTSKASNMIMNETVVEIITPTIDGQVLKKETKKNLKQQ